MKIATAWKLTLVLALVSFFLGLPLVVCDGVGGAAVLTCGDDVALRELAALAAAVGAEGGPIDR